MRIIHNTTFIINPTIEDEWIEFIKNNYIAPLKEQDIVKDILFTKVSIDQPEGRTYSLQLVFNSNNELELFITGLLHTFEDKLIRHYKNHYLCFSSLLHEL